MEAEPSSLEKKNVRKYSLNKKYNAKLSSLHIWELPHLILVIEPKYVMSSQSPVPKSYSLI